MDNFLQDVRYGIRMLLKNPGFTLVAVLTLALGIGANTAIFTVVNAVLLRQMPFPNSDRLMAVKHSYPGLNLLQASVDAGSWDYYRRNAKSFETMAAYSGWKAPDNLTGVGDPQRVRTVSVSGDYFKVLGVAPMMGRTILAQDDQPGERQVVLGYGLWKDRFGADRNILDRQISLNGMNYTVVGVMPAGFEYPGKAELWVPLGLTPEQLKGGPEYLSVAGRLRRGIAPQNAVAEFGKITEEIRRQTPDIEGGFAVVTAPLQEMEVGDLKKPLWVLLGAVTLVLLIACVNIANLLLARATIRQRELSIRSALGASRVRIIRQLLTEGILLALVGGGLGLAFAYWGVDVLMSVVPMELPSFVHVTLDARIATFTLVISVVSGILFGIIPALHVSGPGLNEALKEGGRAAAPGRHRSRRILVISEIALAMVLLVAAGLMIKSFTRIMQADPGFNAEHTLTASLTLPETKYRNDGQIKAVIRDIAQGVSSIPGVTASGLVSTPPLNTGWTNTFFIRGRNDIRPNPHGYIALATSGYAKAMQIPLKRGRFLEDGDTANSAPTAVIDENAARMYWRNEDPIGKEVALSSEGTPDKPVWRRIVGIMGSVKHRSAIEEETKGQIYIPYQQLPMPAATIVVRASGDPTVLTAAIRNQVSQVDRELPIYEVKKMTSLYDDFVAQPRFNMFLLGIFAGLALLLASVGIYAVMSYSVTQLTHEIGIRMALGARQSDVLGMVLKQAARMALMGLGIGVVGALFATRVLQSLLYGVRAYDIATFLTIGLLLSTVALIASFMPARRATRVDPLIALRYE
jgi:predicted permease